MYSASRLSILFTLGVLLGATSGWGPLSPSGACAQTLRPVTNNPPSTAQSSAPPVTVPFDRGRSFGFDPYSPSPGALSGYGSLSGAVLNPPPTMPAPNSMLGSPTTNSLPSTSLPPTTVYQPPSLPYTGGPYNSGINPALTTPGAITPGLPSAGGYPSGGFGAPGGFTTPGAYGSPGVYGSGVPSSSIPGSGFFGGLFGSGATAPAPYQGYPGSMPNLPGSYPQYNGPQPMLPGAGQSAIVQTNPSLFNNNYSQPGVFPNSTPSALFPGASGASGSGGLFGNLFGGGNSGWGATAGNPWSGGYNPGQFSGGFNNGTWGNTNWNPQGTIFNGQYGQPPGFVRLFQGPRIRHSYVHGDKRHNDVTINDTDVAIAMLLPNFAFSNQPIYLLPSFSLHQWAGPRPDLSPTNNADLPSKAYSAFVDAGWQSDPARILGAELGVRVGVFSDFDTFTSRSLRVTGRGIGRVRLTPQATLKLGVMYLDRNRIKLLPAGGILWQPNPATRLDLFFPEPKLSAFLTTLGNFDTWWYVAGYYGGGSWTVRRTDGTKDSIDLNDIRVTLGLEWGRNEMMRDGRRIGFAEVGYVFDRELLYKARPGDNLRLQDTFVVRVGLGY